MALEFHVTEADAALFIGNKIILRYTIYQGRPSLRDIRNGLAVPQDVSNWSLEWVQRVNADDDAAVTTKTTVAGITLTDPPSGKVEVLLERADTVDLSPQTYDVALRRTDAGEEAVLEWGTFTWLQTAGH